MKRIRLSTWHIAVAGAYVNLIVAFVTQDRFWVAMAAVWTAMAIIDAWRERKSRRKL